MIEVNAAKANITADDDLEIETITYEGVNGTMSAYVAKPKGKKKLAAVVVIHENRGLNAHIEDVARRAAKAGYLAIAPNILSPLGELAEKRR
jgi:carboxymethylenebutenolidase